MNTTPDELPRLIHACLDGSATAEEAARLNHLLRGDAAARDVYLQLADTHSCLAVDEKLWSTDAAPMPAPLSRPDRHSWPWLNAAAGILVGVLCTSVVFAYVAPASSQATTLLKESFESGPAPLVTGVPLEPELWSGDFTEVVSEQQGVKAESGKKMLRLLRADYDGKANAEGSRVADIYRLIDVRPYRHEFADGSAVVQLSAGFNAFEFPSGETYSRLTIHAFDAETVTNGSLCTVSAWEEDCLASASTGAARLDRNPATWQRRTSDLRIPANTDFLMIHLIISAGRRTHPEAGFAGHYVDDVRLTIRHSPLK